MDRVVEVTGPELQDRRAAILDRLGMTLEEITAKADASMLMADEWEAWEELRDIAFLLADGSEIA